MPTRTKSIKRELEMLERESDRLKGALLALLPDYKQYLIPSEELRAKIAKELPKDALPASEVVIQMRRREREQYLSSDSH
jgi:hypothetical protein